ncbi:MAG: PAS domain S-box protein [Pseudomonadota bacterium]
MKKGLSKQGKKPEGKDSLEKRLKRSETRREPGVGVEGTLSDERYRGFIENIDDGVYEVDLRGNFTYFNNALCTVFGFPRDEIQGQNFTKFMDEEHGRSAFDIFNGIYNTGKGISDVVWETIDRDQQTRIIELSANLITTKEGEKVGFRGIARDVTHKFKAQEALRESEVRYQCAYEASRLAEKRYRILLDFVPYPMVVFTLDGKVSYLNPAFTETFGWTLKELQGRRIPYVPPDLKEETRESIKRLIKDKVILRHETRRLTKEGRVLDVIMRGRVFSGDEAEQAGELVILRDITAEKRMERTNEALLRISMALPSYPQLEDLLDYISNEVRRLLKTDGAFVILLDEEKEELLFIGAAYDNQETQKRAKEIRYPVSKGISGRVIKTGKPIIVHDTSKDPDFNVEVDEQIHYVSRNMLALPLRSGDRIIGVLSAINKKEGVFDETDIELLNLVAGTVALSIENARFSREITEAYREVTSLNRAKDKVINHLSHELKTPVSILLATMNILAKKMEEVPGETWKPTMDRAQRNLNRILDIQYQVQDIMRDRDHRSQEVLNLLLDQCSDELEALVAEEVGEGPIVERIRNRIREIYGPKESEISNVLLHEFVEKRLEVLRPLFAHRQVEIVTRLKLVPDICVPGDVLEKVVDGLIKNAVEATPDEGRIEIIVDKKGEGAELVVYDCGVGITDENQRRIFEGFFSTQETMNYSSKRPFDFNAGGKGADLLRMKLFAERYNFKIDMGSARCRYIPNESDLCPGRISECAFCKEKEDCYRSGGTAFNVFFPPSPDRGCALAQEGQVSSKVLSTTP